MNTEFKIKDKVNIDGCTQLIGIITAVTCRHEDIVNYEISWVTNGDSKCAVIESWRLSLIE